MRAIAVALSVLLVGVAGAKAADIEPRLFTKTPVAADPGWRGFYVGGNAGYAWGNADMASTLQSPLGFAFLAVDAAAVNASTSPGLKPRGFSGGLQAGYNWQDGPAVFGVEADIGAFRLRSNTADMVQFPSTLPGGVGFAANNFFTTATSVSTDWLFTGRARLGWAHDQWLFYATGGMAVTDIKVNQTLVLVPPTTFVTAASSTRVGWAAGAGFEYAVGSNWSVKGEYLHVDFGSLTTAGTVTPAFAGLTDGGTTRLTADLGRVGVNYRFGAR
jgi:outer membrane immunogenic protein